MYVLCTYVKTLSNYLFKNKLCPEIIHFLVSHRLLWGPVPQWPGVLGSRLVLGGFPTFTPAAAAPFIGSPWLTGFLNGL